MILSSCSTDDKLAIEFTKLFKFNNLINSSSYFDRLFYKLEYMPIFYKRIFLFVTYGLIGTEWFTYFFFKTSKLMIVFKLLEFENDFTPVFYKSYSY